MPIITALETQRQEDFKCTTILNYIGSWKSAWARNTVRREGKGKEKICVCVYTIYIQFFSS